VSFFRFVVEAVHRSPKNPEDYLRNDHRHLFHFKVTFNMDVHDVEELEVIRARRMCLQQFDLYGGPTTLMHFGAMSTLDLADWLAMALFRQLGRGVTVEVAEDGENGSAVTVGEIEG
jgi:hypothetical protein